MPAYDPDSTIFQSVSIRVNEAVGSASISPSGRDVCLASRKGLFLIDLDDPWATPRFLPYYSAIVADVQWSPHPARAHWVVSTSGNKGLVWNLAASTVAPIEHVCLGHERSITDMNWAVFQVDTLATCGMDGNVLVYDLRTGGKRPSNKYCGWRHGATQVKYNRQNPNELASSHGDCVYIWDDRKSSMPVTVIQAHRQKIYGIDYSRKRKDSIVTCSLDSTVKYWTLDGSAQINKPRETLQTASPVWRARHTPFGEGLVTLPQRSEYAVKIWATGAVQKEVFKQTAHADVVREFLWRSKGGDDANDDDRVFQLVTWGNDNQLLLTPIPPSVCAEVGHVPHSPMEVRHLRRNAENRSYRDAVFSPTSGGGSSAFIPGASVSPTAVLHGSGGSGSMHSDGHASKMTPPTLFTNVPMSGRQPLSASSRYGRSANSATSASSAGASPLFGTSPADPKGVHMLSRSYKQGSSLHLASTKGTTESQGGQSQPAAPAFMTRAAGRRPKGQDGVDWMENVRIVPNAPEEQDTDLADEGPATATADGEDASVLGDNTALPLHEEVTALARAFESRVNFEKIAIPQRMVVATLYGPWGTSGVATRLRVTFSFPQSYPGLPVAIDIERSSHIDNKARAAVLTAVRTLAQRYASYQRNALEACLICLLEGKVSEPVETIEAETSPQAHLIMSGLAATSGEVDDVEDERDLERYLANRNCPPPRRCGATFSPTGKLFAFFPHDNSHHSTTEKRQRSVSPPAEGKTRRRRRRLFESFGVIPSLQMRYRGEEEEDAEEDAIEEDSDPVLNIPSLLLGRKRGPSKYMTESHDGTSQYTHRVAGYGRAYNSRVYVSECMPIIGVDTHLSTYYTLQGDIERNIMSNSEIALQRKASRLILSTWITLGSLISRANVEHDLQGNIILGEPLAEKLFIDLLDIFCRLGDVQMLGVLACLLEQDRRNIVTAQKSPPIRPSRSPGPAVPIDYFNVKPIRTGQASSAGGDAADGAAKYTPSLLPLKSPRDWIVSTSYGTQNSSSGSRDSSWAKNLSTLFRSGTASLAGGRGTSTPPAGPDAGSAASPASLSPAFVKRLGPLTAASEGKKAGGISSNRPRVSTGKTRTTTHVSFASEGDEPLCGVGTARSNKPARPVKIRVRNLSKPLEIKETSRILSNAGLMQQLEYYKLLYADLLLRLGRTQERNRVLKLCRTGSGEASKILEQACGLADYESSVELRMSCGRCHSQLSGTLMQYCETCRRKAQLQLCAFCHLPLDGLIETCLSCLHTCHLACIQDWRASEVGCPAACSCLCTAGTQNDRNLADYLVSPTQMPLPI